MNRVLNYKFTPKNRLKVKFKEDTGLPKIVDLRGLCSPIMDQGQEGSCSAHALAGAVEFLELMELRGASDPTELEFAPFSKIFQPVSRNFIYYQERAIEGTIDQDAGAQDLRDGCNALLNVGVPRETLWPYGASTMFAAPNAEAVSDASAHKILSFTSVDDLKQCLVDRFPFVLGFTVYESFMSGDVAQSGIMPVPQPGEQVEGGHAVLAVGYDDYEQAFIVRNSWGKNWGLGGYFYFPYSIMENAQMAGDFYTLRK